MLSSTAGNVLSLLVLLTRSHHLEMRRSYRLIITSLVVWDLLYVLLALALYTLPILSPGLYGQKVFPFVVPLLYPITQVTL